MSSMNRQSIIRGANGIVRIVDRLFDFVILFGILVVASYAIFSLWDAGQIVTNASPDVYEHYRPSTADILSFEELKRINPDVIAWLEIYGTNIDYPVVKSKDNREYLNYDVFGNHSLAGAVFLDAENSADFSDFNSVIHGHHMAEGMMFGNIDLFKDKAFFDEHLYGDLFFDGRNHGLEIFAFLERSAYDWYVFKPGIVDEDTRMEYLETIRTNATYLRDIDITPDEHIVLLGTCAPQETNGRDILVAKLTDQTYENTFGRVERQQNNLFDIDKINMQTMRYGLLALLALMIPIFFIHRNKRRMKTGKREIS